MESKEELQKCPTCGSTCSVGGRTTKYYVPVETKLKERIGVLEDALKVYEDKDNWIECHDHNGFQGMMWNGCQDHHPNGWAEQALNQGKEG